MGEPLVAYYRVSTDKQGANWPGVESQRRDVLVYGEANESTIIAEYTEVETGRRRDRPELAKALAHARRTGATLVIAKLGRLGRSAHFIGGLMGSKVDFVACDAPHATRSNLHVLAAVAEEEARRISERTKAALAAAKARGDKLGGYRAESPGLTPEARRKGARAAGEAHRAAAAKAYNRWPSKHMVSYRRWGWTLQEIADWLNEMGHPTRRGKRWTPTQVARILARIKAQN